MIQTVKQGLEAEGIAVPMTKLCQWFEVPRRSVYYKPIKSAPKVQERLEKPIKALIEQDPSLWLQNRGRPSEHEQEHRSADLPDPGLAGEEAPDRL